MKQEEEEEEAKDPCRSGRITHIDRLRTVSREPDSNLFRNETLPHT